MPTNYPGLTPEINNAVPSDINLDQIIVDDVLAQLNNFSPLANCLKVNISDNKLKVAYDTNYTHATHFQGFIRTRDGKHIIVSGGDKKGQKGCVFVFKIDSVFNHRSDVTLDFGSNIAHRLAKLPEEDQLVEIVAISNGNFWHVGGISAIGDLMVVPIEDGENNLSRIAFYSIANPLHPIHFNHLDIERDERFGKIGCAALFRLPNQYFIMAAWRDEGKVGLFDIYFSKTTDINDGFHQVREEVIQVTFDKLGYNSKEKPQYQSIQFILQSDGSIFLVGFMGKNTYPVKLNGGSNSIDVYQVMVRPQDMSDNPSFDTITVQHLSTIKLASSSMYYNFEAAGSIYTINGRLAIYSPFYWADSHELKFAEFCQSLHTSDSEHYRESIIELYEDKNLKGKCLRLYGKFDNFDLINVSAQGTDFTKKVSSICYLLMPNESLILSTDDGHNLIFGGESNTIKIFPNLGAFEDDVVTVSIK